MFRASKSFYVIESFDLNNHSVEKNINIQQTLFFLKKNQAHKTKKIINISYFNNSANKNEAINILGFYGLA